MKANLIVLAEGAGRAKLANSMLIMGLAVLAISTQISSSTVSIMHATRGWRQAAMLAQSIWAVIASVVILLTALYGLFFLGI
jgi:hypothetical protein